MAALFCIPQTTYCIPIEKAVSLSTDYLTWHDALAIAAVIFAITQFMETTRLRRYLFYLGFLRITTVILVALPLLLVIISNTIFVQDPTIYQISALISFSLLIFLYLAFLKNPQWFRPFFGIKLLGQISYELMDNLREEDLAALAKIISLDLERIIKLAATVQRIPLGVQAIPNIKNKELAERCLDFIDVDLSGENFIEHISKYNMRFVHNVIKYAEKYNLWDAGGRIFFDNLFTHLMTDENSVLTKELKFGGVIGVTKPLSNLIFKSLNIVANYRVFGSINRGIEISEVTLTNGIRGLETSMRDYFKEERSIGAWNEPNVMLSLTIEDLGECMKSICATISSKEEDIWGSKYGSKISDIKGFFERMEYILTPSTDSRWEEPYHPVFSQEELGVQKYTVTYGIVEGLFSIYEGLAFLKNEEYARINALSIYWLILHVPPAPAMKAIQDKFLEKIKNRVEENFKGFYASIIKLLINLYGGELYNQEAHLDNPIAQYFREIFKSRIVPELRTNKKFREENMPSDWFIEDGIIYTTSYDGTKVVVDRPAPNTIYFQNS